MKLKTSTFMQRWLDAIASPAIDPAVSAALAGHRADVPVLWLLGKTGAGKSSIIQRLTGDTRAEVGNGFAPCTRSARIYDHPQEHAVMRFLDTRGLGEASYDPNEDLAACRSASHLLLLVARVDDPDQSALCDALAELGREAVALPILIVHTALHTVPDASTRRRARQFNATRLFEVLGREAPQVDIDFTEPEDGIEPPDYGVDELKTAVIDLLPELEPVLATRIAANEEQAMFMTQRRRVFGYASAAAAVDLIPGLGVVTVPTLQGKMLHTLARRYGIAWRRRDAWEFLTALGTSFLYRYALSFAGRQLGKFMPVYGQTLGAAAAASVSFASTYALGRTACLYLYRRLYHQPLDTAELQRAFREAFNEHRRGDGAASQSGRARSAKPRGR